MKDVEMRAEEEVRNALAHLDSNSRMKIIRELLNEEKRANFLEMKTEEREACLVFLSTAKNGEQMLFESLKSAKEFGEVRVVSEKDFDRDADMYLAIRADGKEQAFSSFEEAACWISNGEPWESANCRGTLMITPEWVCKTYIWGTINPMNL